MNYVRHVATPEQKARLQAVEEALAICGYKARVTVESNDTCTVFVENEATGYAALHNYPSLEVAIADSEAHVARMIVAVARGEA